MGILLISSELEEILGLAHRVLVMRRGRIVAELAGDGDDRGGDPRRRVRASRARATQRERALGAGSTLGAGGSTTARARSLGILLPVRCAVRHALAREQRVRRPR